MRLVDKPTLRPQHCAAIVHVTPFTDTRWVDTGTNFDAVDGRVYLSELAIRQAAQLFGFPTPAEYNEALDSVNQMSELIDNLNAQLLKLEGFKNSVNILARDGFHVRAAAKDKKPAPAPAPAEAA